MGSSTLVNLAKEHVMIF